MTPKNLSVLERLTLVNQFHILSQLADDDNEADSYKKKAEILERGYESEYSDVFQDIWNNSFTSEDRKEVFEILEMFRKIKWAFPTLNHNQQSQLNEGKLSFQGFDANHDKHYDFLEWWDEKNPTNYFRQDIGNIGGFNSHSQGTLDTYRDMLSVFKTFNLTGAPRNLTFAELQALDNA